MNHKYIQELPQEIETRLDTYIERIKNINWFKPAKDISKEVIEKQVSLVLKAFWVEASIEYKQLKTIKDWDAARDAALEAAWGAALDAAWGAHDELLKDNKQFSDKYPNGSFINLIPLYELWLYPIGVVNWKFIVYVPDYK